jgi:DsbC/DsbD-like thiol-disulfide interchange protein
MILMQRTAAAVLALCAAVAAANAQDLPPDRGSHETAHLTATTSVSPEAVAPGRKVTLFVDVVPKPKMHVYSPGQEGYIGVALTLDADPVFTAAKAKYPPGEKLFMKVLNETQLVYAKPFKITQEITIKPGTTAEAATIKGTLRYQACDDRICYLPKNVPVEWALKLTPK